MANYSWGYDKEPDTLPVCQKCGNTSVMNDWYGIWCKTCMAYPVIDNEIQIENEEGGMFLVEIEPGIWGYVGEHVEPGSNYNENSKSGYWIVTSGS